MFVIVIDFYNCKINPFFWKPQLNKSVSFYVFIVPLSYKMKSFQYNY